MKKPCSRTTSRRTHAVNSFKTAAECIGPAHKGMSLFAVTRGQFSMIDAAKGGGYEFVENKKARTGWHG